MQSTCFPKVFLALTILVALSTISAAPLSAATTQILEVLNPRAEVKTVDPILPAPRLSNLEGQRIGIINNTKLGADVLQPELEKMLLEAAPTIKLKSWVISHIPFEGKEKALKDAATASDGIILLLGD
jgi:hypothetical protein